MVAIPGFKNKYFIDEDGNVFNSRGHKMASRISSKGYKTVSLTKDGHQMPYLLHRLICSSFIGKGADGMQVNHIDGDKLNNSICNLEWCTPSENINHAFRSGLRPNSYGKNHHAARRVICVNTGQKFDTIYQAANGCKITSNSIWRVLNGKRKTYKKQVWEYLD